MDKTFEGDAAFFDIIADQAADPIDRKKLHEVADRYRSLCGDEQIPPKFGPTRVDAWRFRAEECRTLADQFSNEQCRKYLTGLAATYDNLAASAETTDFLNSLSGSQTELR